MEALDKGSGRQIISAIRRIDPVIDTIVSSNPARPADLALANAIAREFDLTHVLYAYDPEDPEGAGYRAVYKSTAWWRPTKALFLQTTRGKSQTTILLEPVPDKIYLKEHKIVIAEHIWLS